MGATDKSLPSYCDNLQSDISTAINENPKAFVHSREWNKIMNGDPVQINPALGQGFKIMTVNEWSAAWKRNNDFPDCLSCGGKHTVEHHFSQTWTRGKKKWESEALCMDCHMFSWREYCDPDFLAPEEYEKAKWDKTITAYADKVAAEEALMP
ncbi:hypothetical protein CYMTET_24425 [Cymbomonas tetramitiformis]|uniref:Uncharacterized protein n=1 Tax=Cymbomonas tetramitiformis TaxID=36881 RepID=A0AAE0FVW1_9CHLO|nr:hypothetical protein CYMTET_24425 [Cymbomonas tetramitiformis]